MLGLLGTTDTPGHGAVGLLPNTEHGWAAAPLHPPWGPSDSLCTHPEPQIRTGFRTQVLHTPMVPTQPRPGAEHLPGPNPPDRSSRLSMYNLPLGQKSLFFFSYTKDPFGFAALCLLHPPAALPTIPIAILPSHGNTSHCTLQAARKISWQDVRLRSATFPLVFSWDDALPRSLPQKKRSFSASGLSCN